jgi:hypothetical protein
MKSKQKTELVYGRVYQDDTLVFLEKSDAEYFARLNEAIWENGGKGLTWRDFKKRYPDVYKVIYDNLLD